MKTMRATVKASIAYAVSKTFATDARIAGVLVNADIGPVSYGELHGADLPPGSQFVRFEAVGTDNRNGYDIVRAANGVAYVIVTYAEHATVRGLSQLKAHIAANQDWYAMRLANTWK